MNYAVENQSRGKDISLKAVGDCLNWNIQIKQLTAVFFALSDPFPIFFYSHRSLSMSLLAFLITELSQNNMYTTKKKRQTG